MTNVIKADLDDILFEPREKKYGAYFLRKRNHYYLIAAFLMVGVAFSTATIAPFMWEKLTENLTEDIEKHVIIDASSLPPAEQLDKKELPPPPPPPPKEDVPPPPEKVVYSKPPEPKEILPEQEDTPPPPIDSTFNVKTGKEHTEGTTKGAAEGLPTGTGEPKPTEVAKDTDKDGIFDDEDECPQEKGERKYHGCPPPPPAPKKIEEPDIHTFVFVQEQPHPINMDEIKKAIGYPPIAKSASLEGVVMLRILVDENGNYIRHVITKSAHPLLQTEVEKQAHNLHFTPAIQGGKPIKFWVNIPFTFKLI